MSTITLESIEAKQTEIQQLIAKFKAAQGAGEVVSDYYPELLIARSAVQELEQKVFSLEQCKAILQASVASYQRDMVDPPAYLQDAVIKAAGLGAMAEQIAALKK